MLRNQFSDAYYKILDVVGSISYEMKLSGDNKIHMELHTQNYGYDFDFTEFIKIINQLEKKGIIELTRKDITDHWYADKEFYIILEFIVDEQKFDKFAEEIDSKVKKFHEDDWLDIKTEKKDKEPKAIIDQPIPNKKVKISYNSKDCILEINDAEIKLKYGSKQADLCKTIFADKEAMSKKWDREEILEEWFESIISTSNGKLMPKYRRQVYNAAEKIQLKITLATGIKDLLIFDTQSVSVNSKYVS